MSSFVVAHRSLEHHFFLGYILFDLIIVISTVSQPLQSHFPDSYGPDLDRRIEALTNHSTHQ